LHLMAPALFLFDSHPAPLLFQVKRRRELLHWGPQPDTLPEYSMDKVKEEFQKGEQLLVVDGFVHDVRGFLDEHPAGPAIVKPYLGKVTSWLGGISIPVLIISYERTRHRHSMEVFITTR